MTIKALTASFIAGEFSAVMSCARALLLLPIGYLASRRVASQIAMGHNQYPEF